MDNLFIVGGQRCGSTMLAKILAEHPQICMAQPFKPEPKYFMRPDIDVDEVIQYERRYFSTVAPEVQVLGEKSTSYIESIEAAAAISKFYPKAKILIILREPVARAFSNYKFTCSHGLESESFPMALRLEEERLKNKTTNTSVSPFAYRRRGEYIRYIRQYDHYFPSEQIMILVLEEMLISKEISIDLFRWLGVFVPADIDVPRKRINASPQTEILKVIPHEALISLKAHYEASNQLLAERIGRKIDVWKY